MSGFRPGGGSGFWLQVMLLGVLLGRRICKAGKESCCYIKGRPPAGPREDSGRQAPFVVQLVSLCIYFAAHEA